MRLSGLQKEVLSLYRSTLREIRKKPEVSFVCSQFLHKKAPFFVFFFSLKRLKKKKKEEEASYNAHVCWE